MGWWATIVEITGWKWRSRVSFVHVHPEIETVLLLLLKRCQWWKWLLIRSLPIKQFSWRNRRSLVSEEKALEEDAYCYQPQNRSLPAAAVPVSLTHCLGKCRRSGRRFLFVKWEYEMGRNNDAWGPIMTRRLSIRTNRHILFYFQMVFAVLDLVVWSILPSPATFVFSLTSARSRERGCHILCYFTVSSTSPSAVTVTVFIAYGR